MKTQIFFLCVLLISCGKPDAKPDSPPMIDILASEPKTISIEQLPKVVDREELLKPIFESIELQKKEQLPFDEPKTEFAQQDGKLRPAWEKAYKEKKLIYIFNGDKYGTIGRNSAPFVPQVCADFIVDTLDRAAGTWYRPSLMNPGRYVGKRDIRKEITDMTLSPRRVTDLVTFFSMKPDEFEILFSGDGPKIGNVKETKQWLFEMGIQKGDIIFISGRVPWDRKDVHNHSFIVTGYDEAGLPDKVTGNPAFPVERTIKTEGRRTPLRKVTHIIRLTDKFLKTLI